MFSVFLMLLENLNNIKPTDQSSGIGSPTYVLQDGTESRWLAYDHFFLLRRQGFLEAIEGAAEEIENILNPGGGLEGLLLVILWDEAHSLTDEINNESWTRFSELRRSLRKIRSQPFFSVFLSTAGKFHLFLPDTQFEASRRISTRTLQLFSPITEVGFDQFAIKVKSTGQLSTLREVASTNHMAHLGRSL